MVVLVRPATASLALTAPALAADGMVQAKQTRSMVQKQQRLRDGSCKQSGTPQGTQAKKGNTYAPGDGSDNQGVGQMDGTGYGAPANG